MKGDEPDVEAFLQYSLGVHNTRKSRAGRALENHLEFIFQSNDLRPSRAPETEHRAKPDFLFPGIAEYRDNTFPTSKLTVLGAKYSCKDRWRQILAEALRIDTKHLFTLEPGISKHQTDEMNAHKVQLVIPTLLHETYTQDQRIRLMGLREFISLVKSHQ